MKPYRFHEFHTPRHSPFDNPNLLWFTIVGEFIAPIVKEEKDLQYWFCFHGQDFQFCFASQDYKRIEGKIEAQQNSFGIVSKTAPSDGAKIEFTGGTRWLARDKIGNKLLEEQRAELILSFLHSTCALLIDQLVKEGPYWKIEKNEDSQNPLGNSFESLIHLVSNISQAQFDVDLCYRTAWMISQKLFSLRCHL